ncbi:MAG: hypothetical protein IKL92_01040 [Oscillospiraceae bacterium]|nr:hypothetical protein [Oscillospiraceae bacterium]
MSNEEKIHRMLQESAYDAVSLLVSVMNDEKSDRKLRVDIAKELLSRAYGRGAVIASEEDDTVRFILEGDLERYAR